MQLFCYTTRSGGEPVREFIRALPEETQFEVLVLLRRLENDETLTMPHCRSLAAMARGLYELRVGDRQGQVRIFYYTKLKQGLFLIHALRKKRRTIPDKDRLLIIRRIKELQKLYQG